MATKTIKSCDACHLTTDDLILITISYKGSDNDDDSGEVYQSFLGPMRMVGVSNMVEIKRIEVCKLCFKEIPILRQLKLNKEERRR